MASGALDHKGSVACECGCAAVSASIKWAQIRAHHASYTRRSSKTGQDSPATRAATSLGESFDSAPSSAYPEVTSALQTQLIHVLARCLGTHAREKAGIPLQKAMQHQAALQKLGVRGQAWLDGRAQKPGDAVS